MEKYTTKQIRNIALLGHGGSGKTSFAEAALYLSGNTDRLGRPSDGNTVCDYDPEEIKRGFTLSASMAPVMWNNVKINFIDTPGYLDFVGEVLQAVRVADSALICVDARSGIQVGTELAWDYATEAGIPKAFFINKIDDPEARFAKMFNALRERFGVAVCPILMPMGDGRYSSMINLIDMKAYYFDDKGNRTEGDIPADMLERATEYRNITYESIAETSDELMEKFFAGEEITRDEAVEAIHQGIINGGICPVVCGSSTNFWGVRSMLDLIDSSFPRHTAKKNEQLIDGGETADTPIEPDGTASIFVFKTVADPFVGKMTFFKVMNGTLDNTMSLRNLTSGVTEKFGHIYIVRGKKQIEVDSLSCGDIGMIPKLVSTNTNDTLTVAPTAKPYRKIIFPEPFLTMAIVPKAKGDEDKISVGLTRLLEEDYTIKYENNAETKQQLISGLGDIHLDVIVSRLKSRYGTSVELTQPKIAYRETIKKKLQVEGKHKKQSGGHGQYGHVRITFAPGEAEGLTFTESVVGGAVPKNFFPAVEKGLAESMVKGVLAGYPMVHLAADLYDGSYHDVDSSEMAFKIAANLAYKELVKASPVLLEPIGLLKVYVPDSMVGDVIGDLNKRRGRVLGMSAAEGREGYQVVEAEAPKSEMMDYTIALRALSQGKGKYTFYFTRYEEVPAMIAQKIIDEAKAAQ
ncbi:MAG: elongation factor G [Eubacteriales bacterium]